MTLITNLLNLAEKYSQDLPPATITISPPKGVEIAGWIDHTLLKTEATSAQIDKLAQEAKANHFASVCVNPIFVPQVSQALTGSLVKVCTVVGFPLGATSTDIKVQETLHGVQAGAMEIDMVLQVGALKSAAYSQVYDDISAVAQAAHTHGAIVKVIIETSALTRQEKILACLISQEAGAEFVKTSTGFHTAGANIEDVDLMARLVSPHMKVKASGGIRSYADAMSMIQAGASRLGTSAGVQIISEAIASTEAAI